MKYAQDRYIGGFTPDQQKRIRTSLDSLRQLQTSGASSGATNANAPSSASIIAIHSRAVVGESKDYVSFYAAATGVMFLLFTASGSAGALLDEADSGTLDRVLSSRVTMTSFLGGKLVFNILLAFTQLSVMFFWAWAVFHLDMHNHIAGFVVMGLSTGFCCSRIWYAPCQHLPHPRAALGAVSTWQSSSCLRSEAVCSRASCSCTASHAKSRPVYHSMRWAI